MREKNLLLLYKSYGHSTRLPGFVAKPPRGCTRFIKYCSVEGVAVVARLMAVVCTFNLQGFSNLASISIRQTIRSIRTYASRNRFSGRKNLKINKIE